MLKRVVCSVLNLFVIMLHLEMVSSQLPADQVSSMSRVYEMIENNTASSFVWKNVSKTSNPCSWKGVVCNSLNSSITQVSLTSFSLSTSDFLPFLCNISTLESLDVSNNMLTSIPDGFFSVCGGLSGFKLLNLSVNKFVGSLPSFNNGFAKLETLDFSRNLLSGEIGMQLDGLDSLKILHLSLNFFTGKIPTNLGKLNLLEELTLSANLFIGEIPLEITKYKNLSLIDLSANNLTGSIPREFEEFTKLQTLILSLNSLSGEIPPSISNITTLQRFAANQNMFSGTIPLGITSNLKSLDLSYNDMSGMIPPDLLSGANLEALDLSSNKLEGPVPPITSTKLFRLRLGSNALNGTIPSDSLRSLSELMYLEMDGNNFSGEIPSELGTLRKLALLNLAQNRLTGTLPPSLGNLINLQVLSLQFNSFVGGIPPQILQLNQLEKLNMSRNLLNGSIPIFISRMQNIRNLDLQGNNLRGPIPESIGNLSRLIELQLGNNQLNGRIPSMPGNLQIALNLSYNRFDGPIPVTLSRLQNLEVLDLSNNRFSGEIPSFLAQLGSLTHLLLMNNYLSGEIPTFRDHLVLNTTGNSLLVAPPKSSPNSKKLRSIASTIAIAVAIAAMAIGLTVVMILYMSSTRYKRIDVNRLSENNSNINFMKEMEAVADPSNIIWKTRFSTSYRAVLPSGATYFIKKVNRLDKMFTLHVQEERIGQELRVFGNLSHPNLMIPFAYLFTLRCVYFFYDFSSQGTLSDILHVASGWSERNAIAIGVSQGLASLHQRQIVLLDLSSKSIVLKSPDQPQIGDIELCRLINPSDSRNCSLSTVAGSAGYVPPEYAYTMRVTEAGNVYSFGVVLLELVTGKPAVSDEGVELAKWALTISDQKSQREQVLDSNYVSEIETSFVVRNQMLGVLEVALSCINISPEIRPTMESVVQMLLSTNSL